MAYTLMGNNPIDRGSQSGTGETDIDLCTPAVSRGVLKSVTVWIGTSGGSIKVKVFRDDGTNYVFVGESAAVSVGATGLLTIPCWIPGVEVGDLIGCYMSTCKIDQDGTGTGKAWKSGDVTTTTLKSGWSSGATTISEQGMVFHRAGVL